MFKRYSDLIKRIAKRKSWCISSTRIISVIEITDDRIELQLETGGHVVITNNFFTLPEVDKIVFKELKTRYDELKFLANDRGFTDEIMNFHGVSVTPFPKVDAVIRNAETDTYFFIPLADFSLIN